MGDSGELTIYSKKLDMRLTIMVDNKLIEDVIYLIKKAGLFVKNIDPEADITVQTYIESWWDNADCATGGTIWADSVGISGKCPKCGKHEDEYDYNKCPKCGFDFTKFSEATGIEVKVSQDGVIDKDTTKELNNMLIENKDLISEMVEELFITGSMKKTKRKFEERLYKHGSKSVKTSN